MSGFGSFGFGFGAPQPASSEFSAAARRALAQPVNDLDLQARAPKEEPKPKELLVLSLDLGQRRDPSALVAVQRKGGRRDDAHLLNHIERWPLETPYLSIAEDLESLVAKVPPQFRPPVLLVDVTGVGLGVFEIIRERHRRGALPVKLVGVLIVSGRTVTEEEGGIFRVPKIELVSSLNAMLGTGRLRIARQLPLAKVLLREMQTFSVKITAANRETYEAWRERDHDDLVLAAAQAAWWCGRQRTPAITFGGPNIL